MLSPTYKKIFKNPALTLPSPVGRGINKSLALQSRAEGTIHTISGHGYASNLARLGHGAARKNSVKIFASTFLGEPILERVQYWPRVRRGTVLTIVIAQKINHFPMFRLEFDAELLGGFACDIFRPV